MTPVWAGAPDLPQVPFRRLFTPIRRPIRTGAEIVTAYTDGQVTLRSNRSKIGYHEATDLSDYQGVEVGDFVVHGLDIMRGSVGVSDSSGAMSSVCTICRSGPLIDKWFAAYVIRAQAESGYPKALARGVREGGADFRRWDTLAELPLPVPPIEVQQLVVAYLDAETAKIDTLIDTQERLIETLAERRQAVISHAVTKGLDPNVPMRDSGILWLGQVPRAWSVKRLSWLFSVIGSGTTPPRDDMDYYGPGTPWVTTGELRENTILATVDTVTSKALATFPTLRVYEPGTLLIAMYGATRGRLGVLGVAACTNQACCALASPGEVNTRYVHYALLASRKYLLVMAVGGSQQMNINQDTIRSLRLATPSLAEQMAIVEYLDKETAQMDALSAKARQMIDVLKERRQALISAAVTGKIDVRGLA